MNAECDFQTHPVCTIWKPFVRLGSSKQCDEQGVKWDLRTAFISMTFIQMIIIRSAVKCDKFCAYSYARYLFELTTSFRLCFSYLWVRRNILYHRILCTWWHYTFYGTENSSGPIDRRLSMGPEEYSVQVFPTNLLFWTPEEFSVPRYKLGKFFPWVFYFELQRNFLYHSNDSLHLWP